MPDDYYSLLGIPSVEAEQVRRILQPAGAAPATRQVYGSPSAQAYGDYTSQLEEARDRRSDLAEQAEITRQAMLPTYGGQQARTSAYRKALQDALYEKQTGALLKDLQTLDSADPEHDVQQDEIFARHPIARQALNDPRVASTVKRQAADHAEFQRLFDSDPQARREYATLRADQVDPVKARETVKQSAIIRAQKMAFAARGGNPDDFDRFLDQDGMLDQAKMAYHLAEASRVQKAVSSPTVQKKLLELQTAAERAASTEPTPLQKQAWLSSQGIENPTEEDWSRAYEAVKTVPVQALQTFRQGLGLTPANPAAPVVSTPAPPPSPATTAPVAVNSVQEYEALPSGAIYTDSAGNVRRKR